MIPSVIAEVENMPTLEELLVQTRVLSPSQLAVAQRDAQMRHKRLAQTIIDLGMMDDRRFAQWMARVTGLPLVEPLPEDAVYQLEHRLPRAIAREYQVVPVSLSKDTITVATINPLDGDCLEVLRTTTGLNIRAVVAVYGPLMQLVAKYYPEDDVEPTILPPPMPSAGALTSAAVDESPFNLGSETLQRSYRQPFHLAAPDASPGSSTHIISSKDLQPDEDTNPVTPVTPVSEETLDRIERRVSDLGRAMERLESRLDAIGAALERVLHR